MKAKTTRKCKGCREVFTLANAWQKYCRTEACALAALAEQQRLREKVEARNHRNKLAGSRKLSHWHDLTEDAVNALVRVRDEGLPCVSCDTLTTSAWHAGHFLSVGARPALRYDLANIHRQCFVCNSHKGGNATQYRIRLVLRVGQAEVERLEGPHGPAKFTRTQLEVLRLWALAEARRLRKLPAGQRTVQSPPPLTA